MTDGVCINKAAFYLAAASLNVLTDWAILTLPIPVILKTSWSRRQKFLLCLLFGTGSLYVTIIGMVSNAMAKY